ncbi:hypothetical protein C8J57DRAFT_1521586 [Mycena rebaudengoi]|nr:hypothetical protein C8J57DRAFT_1521586 [Mycena rebaudengoi]
MLRYSWSLTPTADDDDEDLPLEPTHHRTLRSWFPTTLATLFGGVIENPFTLAQRGRVVSEEALLMELLAAEHSDEEPDVGAQEGSGDDYGS